MSQGEDSETSLTEIERSQYKAYKELKQRIERERQLAVVQVNYWIKLFIF